MICEYENVVDSDFCQADKIHHSDKNNTKLNEFLKSFGFQHYFILILILFLVYSFVMYKWLGAKYKYSFQVSFWSFVRSFVRSLQDCEELLISIPYPPYTLYCIIYMHVYMLYMFTLCFVIWCDKMKCDVITNAPNLL